jgi:hypothetical protein
LERIRLREEAFLCHLGDVADVFINSKHNLDATTRVLVFGGLAMPHLRADAPRGVSGTTIRANRLFWNVPVRQHIARQGADWDAIRSCVLRAAVAYPSVSFVFTDLDSGKLVVSAARPSSGLLGDRLLDLFSGVSVIMASTEGGDFKVHAVLYVLRGLAMPIRLQFLHVNGVPVESERLINIVARDLTSSAGPVKMGSPRAQPAFVLQLSCPAKEVQLSPSSELWFNASFSDLASITSAIGDVCMQLGVRKSKSPAPSPVVGRTSPRFTLPAQPRVSPVVSSAMAFRSPADPKSPMERSMGGAVAGILGSWNSPTFGFNNQLSLPAPPSHSFDIDTVRLRKSDLFDVVLWGRWIESSL